MAYDDYELLHVELNGGVATAVVDAPPINLMTLPLYGEISRFGAEVGDDESIRAVVLKSANPDFRCGGDSGFPDR
jgi:enoyl-CoA hydratase/carnithine racemase